MAATPLSRLREKNLMELLNIYREGSGYDRLVKLSQIREIVFKTEPRTLLDFISNINDESHLNILLGCGLKGLVWQAVIKQKAILSGI
jgi:DNA polymerase III alpha subunit